MLSAHPAARVTDARVLCRAGDAAGVDRHGLIVATRQRFYIDSELSITSEGCMQIDQRIGLRQSHLRHSPTTACVQRRVVIDQW